MDNKQEFLILDVAVLAGNILLESGAEIFRVEETINRIAKAYGVDYSNSFVLSSGIFTTAVNEQRQIYANVKHIPINAVHLDRVAAVNQLSREIWEGKYTPCQAHNELIKIQNMPEKPDIAQMAASGMGAGCFCYLFGGDLFDSFTAFIAGFLLYAYLLLVNKKKVKMSKIVVKISGGFMATLLSVILFKLNLGNHLNQIIIGSIIPLIPGVPFTNAIRDLANGDYIAGTVRMVDALLITFGIAMGVGIVYTFYHMLTGGVLL